MYVCGLLFFFFYIFFILLQISLTFLYKLFVDILSVERRVSWLAKSSLCRQPIVRSVDKWLEFGGNKKKCDNSDLLRKTHAML